MTASANAKSKANSWLWQNLEAPTEQAGDRVPYEVLERTPRPDNPTAPADPAEPGLDALTGLPLAESKAKSDLTTALAATTKSTPVKPERPEKPTASQNAQVPDPVQGAGNPLLPAVVAEQDKARVPRESEPEAPLSVASAEGSTPTTPTAPTDWDSILESWHQLLRQWAQGGSLAAAAQEAFNLDGPNAKPQSQGLLQIIVDQLAAGNFENLPEIVFLSGEDMRGAMGAYAISIGKIFINADWAKDADPGLIHAVLTEEQGHHLDGVLNEVDTPGDEGEYFALLLKFGILAADEMAALKSSPDIDLIAVNGQSLDVELSSSKSLTYLGDSRNDNSGRCIGYFSNGDVATAITVKNPDGTNQILISRRSPSGTLIWNYMLSADYNPEAGGLKIDSADNLYVTGTTRLGATGRSGLLDFDTFLAKMSPTGTLSWYKNYGTLYEERADWVNVDSSGNVYINGGVTNKSYKYGYQTITAANGYYGAAFTGGWSGYQLRVSQTDGSVLKAYTTGSSNSGGELMGHDASRNRSYVGGYTFGAVNGVSLVGNGDANGANDYLIARNEATGVILWTIIKQDITSVNVAVSESTNSLYVINKGYLERLNGDTGITEWRTLVSPAGSYQNISIGEDGFLYTCWNTDSNNLRISRYSLSGSLSWFTTLTSSTPILPAAVNSDKNGLLYIHGTSAGSISLDGNLVSGVTRPGGDDAFLLSIDTPTTKFAIRGNSIYTTVSGPKWTQAENNALALGGHLVTINDSQENLWITDTYRNGLTRYYIGLTDALTEGVYLWSSGQAVTYTNWFPYGPEPTTDSVSGFPDDYVEIVPEEMLNRYDGGWNDIPDDLFSITGSWNATTGIAEIPVALSITRIGTVQEGLGSFTTSLNFSAGTTTSGNLANGLIVFWKISGIGTSDLSSGDPEGSGIIRNGVLNLQHSLAADGIAENEIFEVSVYSDSLRQYQIGTTLKTSISDSSTNAGNARFRINGNGTGQATQVLTCMIDVLDPDGMSKYPPSTNGYIYQWQSSSDGLAWSNILNANQFQYSVNLTTDANKFLRVQVGYTDDKGFFATVQTEQVKIISGTSKNDRFQGTSGIDITFSGSGVDTVTTGLGNDFAKGDAGNDTFNGTDGDGDDFFDGGIDTDTLSYSASIKGVIVDMLTGKATQVNTGGIGTDTFVNIENAKGSSMADVFIGNTRNNTFTGGTGGDVFRFASALNSTSNVDTISDFSVSQNDRIELENSGTGLFNAITTLGTLASTAFISGTSFTSLDQRIRYESSTGNLFYDADGSGTGSSIQFAKLSTGLAITNNQFTVI